MSIIASQPQDSPWRSFHESVQSSTERAADPD
jgi:hypothetical protein